jgi:hypothetical protein
MSDARVYHPVSGTLADLANWSCAEYGLSADKDDVKNWLKQLETHGYIWTEVEPVQKNFLTVHISCVDPKPKGLQPLSILSL